MAIYEVELSQDYDTSHVDIYLTPEQIANSLDKFERHELLEILMLEEDLHAEMELSNKRVSMSRQEYNEAIKKLAMNYYRLTQVEESLILNISNRF